MSKQFKEVKILLGFHLQTKADDRKAEQKLCMQIKAMGYEPVIFYRSSKKEILQFLDQNKDCRHVVLMETVGLSTWSQNELADMVDERYLNLVIILTAAKARQLEYLTTLYAAGITSAIFEHGKAGVPAEEVAELLFRPRCRKDAREYYGIDTKNISIRSLTYEMYSSLVIKLMDESYGPSLMCRLLNVAGSINPYLMGDFLSKLPEHIIGELSLYSEYGQLVSQLRESGIRVKYKRPRVYKHMEDDVPFNEYVKKALDMANMDYAAFTEKRAYERGRKSKWKKEASDDVVMEEVAFDEREIAEVLEEEDWQLMEYDLDQEKTQLEENEKKEDLDDIFFM